MITFTINLDEFCEEIFHVMESIQDGHKAHSVTFISENKDMCVDTITERLKPFLINQLDES